MKLVRAFLQYRPNTCSSTKINTFAIFKVTYLIFASKRGILDDIFKNVFV